MTTGVVTFVTADFIIRYPEFTTIQAALPSYFGEATLYLDNSVNSRVVNVETRLPLLWMLTAHIAALNGGVNGQAATPLVGRISTASEGSVSVAAEMPGADASSAWFMQTKYGAAYWQATTRFRRMRYVLACNPQAGAPAPFPQRQQ